MPRLIDADALLTDRRKRMYYHLPNGDTAIPIIDIEHAPTIEERKKGKWKEEVDTGERMLACSACGGRVFLEPYETAVGEYGYRFCPYCGSYNGGD